MVQDDKSATLACNNDQTLFQPTYCIQGNCIDRADTAGCNGKGWTEDVSYTLNTVDRPATAYPSSVPLDDVASTLRAGAGAPKHESDIKGRLCLTATAVSGFKYNMGCKAGGIGFEEEKAPTLSASQHDASVVMAVENHPNDSRVKLSEDNIVQTLSSRMGTGGATRH